MVDQPVYAVSIFLKDKTMMGEREREKKIEFKSILFKAKVLKTSLMNICKILFFWGGEYTLQGSQK